jgi:hypothetical protein
MNEIHAFKELGIGTTEHLKTLISDFVHINSDIVRKIIEIEVIVYWKEKCEKGNADFFG